MKEWYDLKAGKEIRVTFLLNNGFNMECDYFSMGSEKQRILSKCMKADGYRYMSPIGRSRLQSYWYSLQNTYKRMNKIHNVIED